MIYLYCGDVLDFFDNYCINNLNMIITDPPFVISNKKNVTNKWNGYTSFKGDWDVVVSNKWVRLCCESLIEGGIFCSFGLFGNLANIYFVLEQLNYMQFLAHPIWEKVNPAPSIHRRIYVNAVEFILIYSKGGNWTFNYEIAKELSSNKQMKNVWKAPVVKRILGRSRKHRSILNNLMLTLTNVGDVILDPFCGSGSIIESVVENGRIAIGVDNDSVVLEDLKRRLEERDYEVQLCYL